MRRIICLILLVASHVSLGKELPVLRVYTYSAFASEWGPGPLIKKSFEKTCNCEVNFIAAADGNALLARLKLERASPKADVVVGIDQTLTESALLTGLFAESNISLTGSKLPPEIKPSKVFVPYDFSYYAFMFDTRAINKQGKPFQRPKSMVDLLTNPEFRNMVILEDPRFSAPGLAMLLWLKSLYGEKAAEKFILLKNQTLTITKGWSDAYKLFTKGEAPLVFSYITSEAYHRTEDKTDRYQAIIFEEGHYMAIEHSAILKSSTKLELAKRFMTHLISPESQSVIATKNWMYPVISTPDLPKAFTKVPVPSKILQISPSDISKQREAWIQEWQSNFSKN